MAIVNRDLDVTQQRVRYQAVLSTSGNSGVSAGISVPGVITGKTFLLCNVSSPGQLVAAAETAYGVSGAAVHSLWVYRFAGGFTSFAVGQTLAITAFGTSGIQGFSLFGASNSLLAGDQVVLYTQAANTAVDTAVVELVIRNLQDIVSDFGV